MDPPPCYIITALLLTGCQQASGCVLVSVIVFDVTGLWVTCRCTASPQNYNKVIDKEKTLLVKRENQLITNINNKQYATYTTSRHTGQPPSPSDARKESTHQDFAGKQVQLCAGSLFLHYSDYTVSLGHPGHRPCWNSEDRQTDSSKKPIPTASALLSALLCR